MPSMSSVSQWSWDTSIFACIRWRASAFCTCGKAFTVLIKASVNGETTKTECAGLDAANSLTRFCWRTIRPVIMRPKAATPIAIDNTTSSVRDLFTQRSRRIFVVRRLIMGVLPHAALVIRLFLCLAYLGQSNQVLSELLRVVHQFIKIVVGKLNNFGRTLRAGPNCGTTSFVIYQRHFPKELTRDQFIDHRFSAIGTFQNYVDDALNQ